MKKLIFLLLTAVALAGFAFAQDVAHPPGVFDLEAALYGDGADSYAVTPYAVPVLHQAGQPAGIEADYYNSTIGRVIRWGRTVPVWRINKTGIRSFGNGADTDNA